MEHETKKPHERHPVEERDPVMISYAVGPAVNGIPYELRNDSRTRTL